MTSRARHRSRHHRRSASSTRSLIPDDRFWRAVDILYGCRLAIPAGANQAAIWLRFDGVIPAVQPPCVSSLLPLLAAVRLAVLLPPRPHRRVWRYASIWDLHRILWGVGPSSGLFWAIVRGVIGATAYPRSISIIDAILLVCLMGGFPLGRRFRNDALFFKTPHGPQVAT